NRRRKEQISLLVRTISPSDSWFMDIYILFMKFLTFYKYHIFI
ncbi:hypothetical protein M153_24140002083, partial [Pseudoloma neurophilia]